MKYKPPLKTLFRNALRSAFRLPGEMELVAGDAGLFDKWVDISAGAPALENAIDRLLTWAESNDYSLALMQSALNRSDHSELRKVAPLLEPVLKPLRELDAEVGQVEKIIFKGVSFEDIGPWIDQLAGIRRAICRVEPQPICESKNGFGTGFLIAPDLVITAWHVAEPFWKNDELAAKVVLRFGCENDAQGRPAKGEEFHLSRDWSLPNSPVTDCDFALLRLERSAAVDPKGQQREMLKFSNGHVFEPSESILILQHPDALPLKLALGSLKTTENARYIWYDVNTEGGSSGAPCLSQKLDVVGLHHYGTEVRNRGVLASAIFPKIRTFLTDPKAVVPIGSTGSRSGEVESSLPVRPHSIKKRAFIVQSVSDPNTPIRVRADRVMENLIKPVCQDSDYEAVRAHELSTDTITEPIVSALFTDSLVIADLGAPPWNPNVMIEVGYRMSTGRPLVLLADKQGLQEELPLHLQNRRILPIDPDEPAESRDALARLVNDRRLKLAEGWSSQYAYVDFEVPLDRPDEAIYKYANEAAARMYGFENPEDLIGKLVSEIDAQLYSFMAKKHRQAFDENQRNLFGVILDPANRMKVKASVDIPLWFATHRFEDLKEKIYLPLLVQHKFDRADGIVLMRTLYVDISPWSGEAPKVQSKRDVLKIPQMFRRSPGKFTHDLFLPCNQPEVEYMQKIRQTLESFDCSVLFHQNGADTHSSKELIQGIQGSRIVALTIGRRGMGRWEERLGVRDALIEHCRGGNPHLLLVLPELGDLDWQSYVPDPYRELFKDSLYLQLPDVEDLRRRADPGRTTFVERIIRELFRVLRQSEVGDDPSDD